MARQRNLSQEQIKIRILSYLYHKQEGANAHNIQLHGIRSGHTQEAGRFKKLLEELCTLGRIEKIDMSHVSEGRIIYRITDDGRKTIHSLQNYLIKDLLGLTDDDLSYP